MITKENYDYWKEQICNYEEDKLRLSRIRGSSKCPFCGGTKTKPFIRLFANQNCSDCNKDGMISNKKLVEMGLYDFIEKKLKKSK
jgi:hypothetical protein